VRIVVAHKGAREHFLAARALCRQGMLAMLVVDWYGAGSNAGTLLSRLLPRQAAMRALAAQSNELPAGSVHALNFLGLRIRLRHLFYNTLGRPHYGALVNDEAFGRSLAQLDLPPHDVFFGYSYECLKMLQAEQARGVFTVLDQTDPGPVEFRMVAEEMAKHPAFAGSPSAFPKEYYSRLRREWELADLIVVNSEWTRKSIIAEGADPIKIEILPLAYEAESTGRGTERRAEVTPQESEVRPAASDPRPLKVLWLGQVNLRKGIHYLLEAARLLEQETVEFLVAGPLGIRKEATAQAPKNVKWLGPVARSGTPALYQQCDVFVLPTLSDGFAMTQLEALAHGLPVITTPNCGRVVEEGKTGFLVPARDAKALAEAIMRFVRNRGLSSTMAPRCRATASEFSIGAYGRRLVEIISHRTQLQA
jgi:hypothetical protein